MTLLQLAYFVEVCKCRNMTKAAANLHISQPAITKAIQELESEYGARLLLRRKNGQELTGEGQFLYQRAEALLHQAEELDAAMKQLCSRRKTVRVGVSVVFVHLFPDFLRDYQAANPGLELKSYAFGTVELQQHMEKGSIDVVISGQSDSLPFPSRVLLQAESRFWTRRDSPLAGREVIHIDTDLGDTPIGLFRENISYPQNRGVDQFYPLRGEAVANVLFCTNQFGEIRQKLLEGAVSTFLPQHILDDCPQLVSIPTDPPLRFNLLAYWNGGHISSQLLDLVTFAQDYIARRMAPGEG